MSRPHNVTKHDKHYYRIKSTGNNSQKFGNCEVCDKHASETFIQAEYEEFKPDRFAYVSTKFGHEDCLLSIRS